MIDDFENGSEERYSPDSSEIAVISPDELKIHGLIVNKNYEGGLILQVPMETLDNQIDFNTLEIIRKPPGDDF